MRKALIFLLVVCLTSLSSFKMDIPERVSMVKLLTNPDAYHGKRVMASGFLHLEFEDYGLYFSREHANYLMTENAIWVDFGKNMRVEDDKGSLTSADALNRKYVMIIGTFNKDGMGHLGMFAGEIKNIERIYQLKKWYQD